MGRKDIRDSSLKVPNVIFDDKLVLDDGKQRVEFLFFGHAHTAGDACAYLPKQKILCTGDACVNGSFNYMGHSDSASWIRALEGMQQLDVKMICPGHGSITGKNLLMSNLTGNPCVVLPSGFSTSGTPTSLCFIGRLFGEAQLLAVAKKFQDATDFHRKHPKLD